MVPITAPRCNFLEKWFHFFQSGAIVSLIIMFEKKNQRCAICRHSSTGKLFSKKQYLFLKVEVFWLKTVPLFKKWSYFGSTEELLLQQKR